MPEEIFNKIFDASSVIVNTILRYYPASQGVYLFGSFQTENEWPDSDVDIAILLPHEIAKREASLALSDCRYALEDQLQKEVDLVNLRLASTVFQFQVVTTGRVIYRDGSSAVDEFEIYTLSFYQKLNEERAEILKEFYKTGRAYRV